MEKILVPTDFSPPAEAALVAATEISRKTKASVELLHIIDAPSSHEFNVTGEVTPHDGLNDVYVLKSIEQARHKMRVIMDDVRFAGVRFIPRIRTEDTGKNFTALLLKEKTDLIVMGTAGASTTLRGIFNKTNTEEVVAKANCMVLSVKEGIKEFRLKHLLYATNFEDDTEDFITEIRKLQEVFDFRIHIGYINALLTHKENQETIHKKLDEFLKRHGVKDYEFHLREDYTEYSGITDTAKAVKADVIALTTHQRKGFWHWLGGISEDLVNYADIPVLTYKAGK